MSAAAASKSATLVNRKLLSQLFPHLVPSQVIRSERYLVSRAASGDPTLQITGSDGRPRWIHSRFNPKAEGAEIAARWACGRGLYIVFGFGFGYHVEALMERIPAGSRVLVVEPDPELFALAVEFVPLDKVLKYPGLSLAVGPEEHVVRELQRIDITTSPLEPRICVHPALARLFSEQYRRCENAIRGEFNRAVLDAATTIHWDLTWGKNTMENLPRVLASYPVRLLFNCFRGVPAIVVSAGPSLDVNIDVLKSAEGKAVIIAVGTALRALKAHSIRPTLVVSYDGSEANYRHFQGLAYDDIPLVYDPMIYPAIPREHGGQQWVMATTSNPFMPWLERVLGSPGVIASGGSVATAALDVAVKLGCNPLIFVGQDLAYRAGHTHAAGTVYQDNKVQEAQLRGSMDYLEVPSVSGGTVWTSRAWYGFLTWFEHYIAAAPSDLHFIDATEGGALIRGTQIARLRDVIDEFCGREVPAQELLHAAVANVEHPWASVEAVMRHLESGIEALGEIRRITKRAAGRAEEAQRLVEMGVGRETRLRKIMEDLDEVDRDLKSVDRDLYRLMYQPAYRTALRLVRGSSENSEGDSSADEPDPVTILGNAKELYQAIANAAQRTRKVLEKGLGYLEASVGVRLQRQGTLAGPAPGFAETGTRR